MPVRNPDNPPDEVPSMPIDELTHNPQAPANIGPLLILEIGKLQGVQSTMLISVNSLATEVRRLSTEMDRRHEINQTALASTRAELQVAAAEHTKEDDIRFAKINRVVWAAGGIFGFINFVLLIANLYKNFQN